MFEMGNAVLTAVTGDNQRPLLVAICLIVSVILMVVLIIMGSKSGKDDGDDIGNSEDMNEPEE